MKFWCKCGYEIHDTTDHLSYKGAIIADQDIDVLWGIIEKLQKPHSDVTDVYRKISKILERNIYQCPDCGRLFVEDQADHYKLVAFKQDTEGQEETRLNKRLLLSAYAEKWKGYLYADWYDDKPEWLECHGIITPIANVEFNDLWFDDPEAFKKRFYEVFEQMKKLEIIRNAVLRINRKIVFQWPEQ